MTPRGAVGNAAVSWPSASVGEASRISSGAYVDAGGSWTMPVPPLRVAFQVAARMAEVVVPDRSHRAAQAAGAARGSAGSVNPPVRWRPILLI
jgi:hypothetical protein